MIQTIAQQDSLSNAGGGPTSSPDPVLQSASSTPKLTVTGLDKIQSVPQTQVTILKEAERKAPIFDTASSGQQNPPASFYVKYKTAIWISAGMVLITGAYLFIHKRQ